MKRILALALSLLASNANANANVGLSYDAHAYNIATASGLYSACVHLLDDYSEKLSSKERRMYLRMSEKASEMASYLKARLISMDNNAVDEQFYDERARDVYLHYRYQVIAAAGEKKCVLILDREQPKLMEITQTKFLAGI